MRTHRFAFGFMLAAAFVLAASACSGPAGTPQGTSTTGGAAAGGSTSANVVTMQSYAFSPAALTAKSGDAVTFKNADSVAHHVVVGNDDLGLQQPGVDKTWTAPKDGVYIMKCLIHSSMQGQITVGAGGGTVGTPPTTGGSGGYGY